MTSTEEVEVKADDRVAKVIITDEWGVSTDWNLYASEARVTIQVFTGAAAVHVYATPEQMTELRDALNAAIEVAQ